MSASNASSEDESRSAGAEGMDIDVPNDDGTVRETMTMIDFLTNKLRFARAAAEALIEQGLESYEDLMQMVDQDVKDICDRARSPGGMVTVRQGNRDTQVADRGVKIGYIQEKNLKQARFYINHCHRIQRYFDPSTVTMNEMRSLWDNRFEHEKDGKKDDGKDDEELKPLKQESEIKKALEDLDSLLANRLGVGGSPLAYVVRKNVKDEEDPGMNKPTIKDELIRRTRHDGAHYDTDNGKVWRIIRGWAHKGPAWNWVSKFARKCDGRGAYMALKTHYLGPTFTSKTISDATTEIQTIYFSGRSKNFTFDAFCGKLNKAFSDLEEAGEPLSERMKVQALNRAIQDPVLTPAKLTLISNVESQQNYDWTLSFYKQALNSLSNTTKSDASRSVSAVNTDRERGGRGGNRGSGRGGRGGGRGGRGGRGRGGGRGQKEKLADKFDPENPGKSLTSDAWKKLSDEQRATAREARNNKRNVSALTRDVSALAVNDDNADGNNEDEQRSVDHFRPGDQPAHKKKKGGI